MPRRAALDPPDRLNIGLPETDKAWLDQHLWSEVDNRVPQGAYRKWFLDRLHEYRYSVALDLAPYGFPTGMHVRGSPEVIRRLEERLRTSTPAANLTGDVHHATQS